MNIKNKIISSVLTVTMLFPAFAGTVSFAQDLSEKSISNDYMTFSVNDKTGFFDIATLEGHPQKANDNNMPLLYDGDSIQTSFTTVRVDGKDYIFGQDYGLFDINAKIGTTTVDAVNNSISTEWSINGIKVTQTAYLSRTDNTVTTGNVGLSYEVENTTSTSHDVGIRVMLDNSLGAIDAPITLVQSEISPIAKETEFFVNDKDPGSYIRFIDNNDVPSKEAYILFDTPIVDVPDSVIVGHWYNLASSKWTYSPDNDLSFSTGFNSYGTADTATALYWNEQKLSAGESYSKSMLYGVGDFSVGGTSGAFNISLEIDDEGLVLNDDKYVDNTVDAHITVYNNLDGSVDLNSATLNLACEDGAFFIYDKNDDDEIVGMQSFIESLGFIAAGSVVTYDCELFVNVPDELKAIKVTAELVGNTEKDTSIASQYIIAPAPNAEKPKFAVTDIANNTFHISGTRVFALSGIFDTDLLEDRSKWAIALVSTSDPNLRYEINSSDATLTSETAMSIIYSGDMVIGEYEIEFSFFEDYATFFGNTYIGPKIYIVNDESLVMPKYSLLGVVRYGTDYASEYKIITFSSEEDLTAKTASINATSANELILVLRGEFQVDYTEKGEIQGYTALSDFTVNDVATGLANSRLEYFTSNAGGVRLKGVDAVYSAAKGLEILGCDWKIEVNNGIKHSLSSENVKLEADGFTNVILNIAGGLLNLKFGVFGKNNGNYVISYGGTLSLIGYDPTGQDDISVQEQFKGRHYKGLYASCDVSDVMFDKNGFVGIDTTVKIALVATNVIGCAQADAFAVELMINTIDDKYSGIIDLTIAKKLMFTLGLGINLIAIEGKGDSVAMVDSLVGNFAVPPIEAVPLIPGALGLYMFGLNLSGLDDLVDFSAETPTELRQSANQATTNITVTVGLTAFEVFGLIGSASVGTNHLYLTCTGSVIAMPAITATFAAKAGWKLAVYDNETGVRLTPSAGNIALSGELNLLGIIKGGTSASYSYVDLANAER